MMSDLDCGYESELAEEVMPSLVRPAEGEYRSWIVDSRHWDRYRPRADHIIIATYPKCGTTWT